MLVWGSTTQPVHLTDMLLTFPLRCHAEFGGNVNTTYRKFALDVQ